MKYLGNLNPGITELSLASPKGNILQHRLMAPLSYLASLVLTLVRERLRGTYMQTKA